MCESVVRHTEAGQRQGACCVLGLSSYPQRTSPHQWIWKDAVEGTYSQSEWWGHPLTGPPQRNRRKRHSFAASPGNALGPALLYPLCHPLEVQMCLFSPGEGRRVKTQVRAERKVGWRPQGPPPAQGQGVAPPPCCCPGWSGHCCWWRGL